VVVGVGLNVNQDEFPDDTEATSIKHAFGQALPVEQPLMYLIYRMEQVYEQIVDFSEILATFKTNSNPWERNCGYEATIKFGKEPLWTLKKMEV